MELEDNKLMSKTFFWMFIGLLGTAIVAWYTREFDTFQIKKTLKAL